LFGRTEALAAGYEWGVAAWHRDALPGWSFEWRRSGNVSRWGVGSRHMNGHALDRWRLSRVLCRLKDAGIGLASGARWLGGQRLIADGRAGPRAAALAGRCPRAASARRVPSGGVVHCGYQYQSFFAVARVPMSAFASSSTTCFGPCGAEQLAPLLRTGRRRLRKSRQAERRKT